MLWFPYGGQRTTFRGSALSFSPCGSQGSNSCPQAWFQVAFPTLSHLTGPLVFLNMSKCCIQVPVNVA